MLKIAKTKKVSSGESLMQIMVSSQHAYSLNLISAVGILIADWVGRPLHAPNTFQNVQAQVRFP